MKSAYKGTIKNKALVLAAMLLTGAVAISATGCKGEIKAGGISIDTAALAAGVGAMQLKMPVPVKKAHLHKRRCLHRTRSYL